MCEKRQSRVSIRPFLASLEKDKLFSGKIPLHGPAAVILQIQLAAVSAHVVVAVETVESVVAVVLDVSSLERAVRVVAVEGLAAVLKEEEEEE